MSTGTAGVAPRRILSNLGGLSRTVRVDVVTSELVA